MKLSIRVVLFLLVSSCHTLKPLHSGTVLVPSSFIDKERFYIQFPTHNGDTLLGFGDTGGGFTAVYEKALEKAQAKHLTKTDSSDGQVIRYILFRDLIQGGSIPSMAVHPFLSIREPVFLIPPEKAHDSESQAFREAIPHDIFLGQYFFLGKSWTFDYVHQKIYTNTPLSSKYSKQKGIQPLGFKKDEAGRKLYGHPSMTVIIDGDTLDMLFDTGASFILSENGKQQLGTTKKTIGGSFIARSVFDKWKSRHPEWKVYPNSDGNTDIIEVPEVTLGNCIVGPVLFSVRPDEAWSKWMIQSMDKVVQGAIGGSALQYVIVTADYINESIFFRTE